MQKYLFPLFLIIVLAVVACNRDDNNNARNIPDDPVSEPVTDPVVEEPVKEPTVKISNFYNDLFTRNGNGWTGADGTLSLRLTNGKTLWFFGDTFLDTVLTDRIRPTTARLIKNTIVVQDANEFITLFSKIPDTSAFAKPIDDTKWYWPLSALEQPDGIEVIYQKFEPTASNSVFSFKSIGFDIVVLDKVDYSIKSIVPKIEREWFAMGVSILKETDFNYIYGIEKVENQKFMHIARVPKGSLLQEWSYWNGDGWTNNHLESKQLLEGVSDQYSVFFRNDKYYLLTQTNSFGNMIKLFETTAPTGDWINEKVIYETPFLGENTWSYNALAHPDISGPNELLISYNVNSLNFIDIYNNADLYRPYFIEYENF